MWTMNSSSKAAASGIEGWYDGVTYMAGLSGGSWGVGTFMATGGPLPSDLIISVSIFAIILGTDERNAAMEPGLQPRPSQQ